MGTWEHGGNQADSRNSHTDIEVTMLEIYSERIRDLLVLRKQGGAPTECRLHETAERGPV